MLIVRVASDGRGILMPAMCVPVHRTNAFWIKRNAERTRKKAEMKSTDDRADEIFAALMRASSFPRRWTALNNNLHFFSLWGAGRGRNNKAWEHFSPDASTMLRRSSSSYAFFAGNENKRDAQLRMWTRAEKENDTCINKRSVCVCVCVRERESSVSSSLSDS